MAFAASKIWELSAGMNALWAWSIQPRIFQLAVSFSPYSWDLIPRSHVSHSLKPHADVANLFLHSGVISFCIFAASKLSVTVCWMHPDHRRKPQLEENGRIKQVGEDSFLLWLLILCPLLRKLSSCVSMERCSLNAGELSGQTKHWKVNNQTVYLLWASASNGGLGSDPNDPSVARLLCGAHIRTGRSLCTKTDIVK